MSWYTVGISAASMLANMLMKSKGSGGGMMAAPPPPPSKQLIQAQPYIDQAQQFSQYMPQGQVSGSSLGSSQVPPPSPQGVAGGQSQFPSIYESIMKQWGQ